MSFRSLGGEWTARERDECHRHDEDQRGTDDVMGQPGGQRQQPGQGLTVAR